MEHGTRSTEHRPFGPALAAALFTAAWIGAVSSVPAGTHAQPPTVGPVTVQATVDRAEATIGDLVRYTLTVRAAPGTEVRIPALSGRIGALEIVDFGDVLPQTPAPETGATHWYVLRTFDVGEHTISVPPVRYRSAGADWQEATANDVRVAIQSLLGDDQAVDIRDIKPPEAVPFDWRPLAIVGGALVTVLALAAGLFHLLSRPRRARAVAPLPPDAVALAALARLHAERLPDAGRFDAFYVGLSAIVRKYLEDRFAVHAPEMTTEEFLATAARDGRLASAHKRLLGEFLAEADLVKFARLVPTVPASEAAFDAARRFVNDTRPAPAPESNRAAA